MLSSLGLVGAGLAGVGAGFVNALAGGGTLISFPVLTALGMSSVAANVTNTVALCPGFIGGIHAQRADLRTQTRRVWLVVPVAALGGLAGGLLLLNSGERVFRTVVPYLILGATGLLAAQDPLRAWLLRRRQSPGARAHSDGSAIVPIGLGAVYGGYFGAGFGVILLATLGLLLDDSLTRLNALKQVIALSANAAAAALFVFSGEVSWPVALVMAIGAMAGGALGGRLASRVQPRVLKRLVIVVGLVVGLVYLVK